MLKPSPRTQLNLATAAFLLMGVVSASTAMGQGETESRSQYDAAMSLFHEKKYAEARKSLEQVWATSKTYDVATLYGQLERVEKRYADAAKYFAFAVTNFPPTEDQKRLTVIRKWLDEAKKQVLTLDVKCSVEGAAINVDNVDLGTTPLKTSLFLEPGRHVVLVKKAGFKLADRSINAAAGATDSWDVTLVAQETATPTPAPPINTAPPPVTTAPPVTEPPQPTTVASGPNPWVLVGGGVVTVGALVTGLVFNSKAGTAEDRADKLSDQVGTDGCTRDPSGFKSECSMLMDYRKDYDFNRNIATGAFVAGGAALVGTVVYWLWPRSETQTSGATIHLQGTASRRTGWLGVVGSF